MGPPLSPASAPASDHLCQAFAAPTSWGRSQDITCWGGARLGKCRPTRAGASTIIWSRAGPKANGVSRIPLAKS
eukprot:8250466-Pyramimonas_sp.AAC.1